jgi:hypothetical protein
MGEICEWTLGYWWLRPHPLDGLLNHPALDELLPPANRGVSVTAAAVFHSGY